ncbi:P23-1 [Symbiodinium sp. CCMP2456]|nr:P23-1 [Symbiodinium sp. CCMP2456]
MSLTPDVLWAQRPDAVYLTIDLKEVQDIKVNLDADKMSFYGKVGGSLYEFSLDFFAPIAKEESKWSTKRLIEFYLKKETEGSWTSLSKVKKLPWVKVDWKRWQDSDDEDEGKQNAWNLDGLGDMNFGDMGADAEYDSDDEELPDLDPAEVPLGAAGDAPQQGATGGEPKKVAETDTLD